ncbi:GMC oxidoreductase [Actinomadura kijaniata]|uniref:GMC oxidoreductase n=1 Tax=Actinomadura kijaniata TaxID=46161 RepID=UPI003F1CAA22
MVRGGPQRTSEGRPMKVPWGLHLDDRAPLRHDRTHRAVIIGSGVGGSIAAFRLAEAGVDTLVLERGRRWPITDDTFPPPFVPDRRTFWLDGPPVTPLTSMTSPTARLLNALLSAALPRSTGLLEVLLHRDLTLVCGAGVGGSTLTYAGMLPQPRPEPFRRLFPDWIDYDEFDRVYYPRARARMGAQAFPSDLLAHPRYHSARLVLDAYTRTRLPAERVLSSYDFQQIRAELSEEIKPAATVGNYTFTGCNSGAKMSIDRTYLARAEATGKTVVRPLHKVTSLAQGDTSRFQVTIDHLDRSGSTRERIVLHCDHVVVAAGAVHTPRLLVSARDTGDLPLLNDHVGGQWGTNADHLVLLRTRKIPTGAHQAGPPAFYLRNRPGTAMVVHGGQPFPTETRLLLFLGVGIPDRLGRWHYDFTDGRTRLDWAATNDTTARRQIMRLLNEVADTITSTATVIDPLAGHRFTVHPLGGAVIGKATDRYGRLHGHPGLYCLDGALIPGSTGGVNPALTIAALVEFCLDHIIDDFRK